MHRFAPIFAAIAITLALAFAGCAAGGESGEHTGESGEHGGESRADG